MGSIPGLLGLNGGAGGSGFSGPESADIMVGVTPEQATQAFGQSNDALAKQQALLQALQGSNGIGNQQTALQQQQQLAQQQQQTAGMYQNLASGVGPNPAQAQFAQNTAQNVAQTGALMAGQRGASQNVGLIARQAGMQGAQQQQTAAGQAATLQAQQQLQGLQGLSAQQAAIGQTNQNAAQIAANQINNQVGQTNANTNAAQAQYGNVMNAIGAVNNAKVGMQSNVNNVNGQLANTMLQGQQAIIGGLMNGGGAKGLMGAEGGEVFGDEDKTTVQNPGTPDTSTPTFSQNSATDALSGAKKGGGGGGGLAMLALLADGGMAEGPQSPFGQFLTGVKMSDAPNVSTPSFGANAGADALREGAERAGKKLMGGQKSDADGPAATIGGYAGAEGAGAASGAGLSGFASGAMSGLSGLSQGGMAQKDLRSGGPVTASGGTQKAVASGDDYANDKIPAMLSEHEIVLPRSVTMSKDPVKSAASFVQSVLAKRKARA